MFVLLKLTFSLPLRPLPLAQVLHSKAECFPTDVFYIPQHRHIISPVHLRCKSARSVSYYALFQGRQLLGKPVGCLCTATAFITGRSFRGLSW
ncbi:unnamed protein product [Lactuca virosa]|uniref:Secreted protein n=1 Tax=Lactuca virosa TaxID=75947 RepID=A0AAU9NT06_9ASTR|nr:unnamed protein product [Lactuca virosa]